MGCELSEYDRMDALQCEKYQKQNIDKMTFRRCFSSDLVLFQATLSPFCLNVSHMSFYIFCKHR